MAEEVELKVEVKRENLHDGPTEDGGQEWSSCAASSSLATSMINVTAGNAPLVCVCLVFDFSVSVVYSAKMLILTFLFSTFFKNNEENIVYAYLQISSTIIDR